VAKRELAVLNSTRRQSDYWKGDCIDCKQCVNFVQPVTFVTGHKWNVSIVPLVDECDTIMDSVGLPRDLYDTLLKMKLRKKVAFKHLE
jgi:hypothetical protein